MILSVMSVGTTVGYVAYDTLDKVPAKTDDSVATCHTSVSVRVNGIGRYRSTEW